MQAAPQPGTTAGAQAGLQADDVKSAEPAKLGPFHVTVISSVARTSEIEFDQFWVGGQKCKRQGGTCGPSSRFSLVVWGQCRELSCLRRFFRHGQQALLAFKRVCWPDDPELRPQDFQQVS